MIRSRTQIRFALRTMQLVLWCACTAAVAAPPPAHPCAVTPQPADRLACYDRAFPPPAEVNTAAAAQAVQAFGLGNAPTPLRNPGQSTEDANPEQIEGRVAQVRQAASGPRVVELENGQKWTIDTGSAASIQPGDLVQLRKGALGSYLLRTAGGISLRARRVR